MASFFSSDHRPHRVCKDFTRLRVLVSTDFTRFTVNPAVTGSSPCFSQKLSNNFFRHCATFNFFSALCDFQFFSALCDFEFFWPSKGPTLKFLLIFCSKIKCQRVSFFMYFGTMRLFKILIFRFFSKISKSRIFLSPKVPLQFI